ncbi:MULTISPECIES: hypothetical protein [Pseudoalteromonas]|uniref:Lipoprotein n=1 Tax=Pseudoalteromonas obscura TaxID=3048491 RepID=A0ABT7EKJ9_9GAMM|nr:MULTISPECIES: hypothetical protein [Pseudoalteromonas]MBQ4837201.1 hypothetical protein [Pseudoalteromonas luteoviolacea]MDK2595573.1 hypothetical protein [Pseudoalteromonas sp. P94(2023)]
MKILIPIFLLSFLSACVSVNTIDDLRVNSDKSPVYSAVNNYEKLEYDMINYLTDCFSSTSKDFKMNGVNLGSSAFSLEEHKVDNGVDFVLKRYLNGGMLRESGFHYQLLYALRKGDENQSQPTVQVYSKVLFRLSDTFDDVEKIANGEAVKCYPRS